MIYALVLCMRFFGQDVCAAVSAYEVRADCEESVLRTHPPTPTDMFYRCDLLILHKRKP